MSQQSLPLITIITVVYNGGKDIEKAIMNVLGQTYQNIEYIVIDGNSTDNTLEIIKKYESRITRWISEKDEGIYHAMNKGASLASGMYVNFMNCGDTFFENTTVEMVMNKINNEDFIYGDYIADYGENGMRTIRAGNIQPPHRMILSHQSVFVKKELLMEFPFNESFKISSDLDFYHRCYRKSVSFLYVPIVVSVRSEEGFSDMNRQLAIKESRAITKKIFPRDFNTVFLFPDLYIHISQEGREKYFTSICCKRDKEILFILNVCAHPRYF